MPFTIINMPQSWRRPTTILDACRVLPFKIKEAHLSCAPDSQTAQQRDPTVGSDQCRNPAVKNSCAISFSLSSQQSCILFGPGLLQSATSRSTGRSSGKNRSPCSYEHDTIILVRSPKQSSHPSPWNKLRHFQPLPPLDRPPRHYRVYRAYLSMGIQ